VGKQRVVDAVVVDDQVLLFSIFHHQILMWLLKSDQLKVLAFKIFKLFSTKGRELQFS